MKLDISQLLSIYEIDYSTEHRFHSARRWRFDYILLPEELKIAIEYEGGTWSKGRHVSGKGYAGDCEKYNAAILEGWKVLRYTSDMVSKAPEQIIQDIMKLKYKLEV